MNAQKFHFVLEHFTSVQPEEADQLVAWQRDFPYSQVIHHLVAKASQDLNLPERDPSLRQSAIYATDRSVLKSLMAAPWIKRPSETPKEPIEIKATFAVDAVLNQHGALSDGSPAGETGDIYIEVQRDLEQLTKSKHRFEEVVELLERNARPLSAGNPTDQPQVVELEEIRLIEDIKNTKQQIKLEGHKQQEQTQIIDQFIKAQPTINKLKPATEPRDLAEKTELPDAHIVSETLVEILLKQGKTEKAAEMLKKLIWKFPQKKAYFAARIEELKN